MNFFVHLDGLIHRFPEKWPKTSQIQSLKENTAILLEKLLENLSQKHAHYILLSRAKPGSFPLVCNISQLKDNWELDNFKEKTANIRYLQ